MGRQGRDCTHGGERGGPNHRRTGLRGPEEGGGGGRREGTRPPTRRAPRDTNGSIPRDPYRTPGGRALTTTRAVVLAHSRSLTHSHSVPSHAPTPNRGLTDPHDQSNGNRCSDRNTGARHTEKKTQTQKTHRGVETRQKSVSCRPMFLRHPDTVPEVSPYPSTRSHPFPRKEGRALRGARGPEKSSDRGSRDDEIRSLAPDCFVCTVDPNPPYRRGEGTLSGVGETPTVAIQESQDLSRPRVEPERLRGSASLEGDREGVRSRRLLPRVSCVYPLVSVWGREWKWGPRSDPHPPARSPGPRRSGTIWEMFVEGTV